MRIKYILFALFIYVASAAAQTHPLSDMLNKTADQLVPVTDDDGSNTKGTVFDSTFFRNYISSRFVSLRDATLQNAVNPDNYTNWYTAFFYAYRNNLPFLFPPKEFNLTQQVVLDSAALIKGTQSTNRRESFFWKGLSSSLKFTANLPYSPAIQVTQPGTAFRDFQLRADSTAITNIGIQISRTDNSTSTLGGVTLDNVHVRNFDSHGIVYVAPDNGSQLKNVSVIGNGGTGVKVDVNGNNKGLNFRLTGGRIAGNGGPQLHIRGVDGNYITGAGILSAKNGNPLVLIEGGTTGSTVDNTIMYCDLEPEVDINGQGDSTATIISLNNTQRTTIGFNRIGATEGIGIAVDGAVRSLLLLPNRFINIDLDSVLVMRSGRGVVQAIGDQNGWRGDMGTVLGGNYIYSHYFVDDDSGQTYLDAGGSRSGVDSELNLNPFSNNDVTLFRHSTDNPSLWIYGQNGGVPDTLGQIKTNNSQFFIKALEDRDLELLTEDAPIELKPGNSRDVVFFQGAITGNNSDITVHGDTGSVSLAMFSIKPGQTGRVILEALIDDLRFKTPAVNIIDMETSALDIYHPGSSAGETGAIRLNELGGGQYVEFKCADTLAANNSYVLPSAYPGANDYVLVSSTAGVMEWKDATPLSDSLFKKDINDWSPLLEKILKIKTKRYVFKDDSTNTIRYGFVAQQLEEHLPEAVKKDTNGNYRLNTITLIAANTSGLLQLNDKLEANADSYNILILLFFIAIVVAAFGYIKLLRIIKSKGY